MKTLTILSLTLFSQIWAQEEPCPSSCPSLPEIEPPAPGKTKVCNFNNDKCCTTDIKCEERSIRDPCEDVVCPERPSLPKFPGVNCTWLKDEHDCCVTGFRCNHESKDGEDLCQGVVCPPSPQIPKVEGSCKLVFEDNPCCKTGIACVGKPLVFNAEEEE